MIEEERERRRGDKACGLAWMLNNPHGHVHSQSSLAIFWGRDRRRGEEEGLEGKKKKKRESVKEKRLRIRIPAC
jgi:hypothetical protein